MESQTKKYTVHQFMIEEWSRITYAKFRNELYTSKLPSLYIWSIRKFFGGKEEVDGREDKGVLFESRKI